MDMPKCAYIHAILQDLPIAVDRIPDLPVDDTCVKVQLPSTNPGVLNLVPKDVKKSEVVKQKLKSVPVDSTATDPSEEEELSQSTIADPAAIRPAESAETTRFL